MLIKVPVTQTYGQYRSVGRRPDRQLANNLISPTPSNRARQTPVTMSVNRPSSPTHEAKTRPSSSRATFPPVKMGSMMCSISYVVLRVRFSAIPTNCCGEASSP